MDESAALIGASVAVFTQDKTTFQYIDRCVNVLLRNVIKARDRLLQIVATHHTIVEALFSEITETEPNPEKSSDTNSEDFSSDLKSHKDTSSYRWVISVFNSVQIGESDMPENIYHSSRFEKYLIHTFVRSPLWSNPMLHEFEWNYDYATSTPVESEFKTIKSLLNFKKYRVDAFLKKRLEHLSGQMKIAKADQNQKRNLDNTSVRKRSDSLDMIELKKNQSRRSASFQEISMDSLDFLDSTADNSLEIYEDWRNKVKRSSQTQEVKRQLDFVQT